MQGKVRRSSVIFPDHPDIILPFSIGTYSTANLEWQTLHQPIQTLTLSCIQERVCTVSPEGNSVRLPDLTATRHTGRGRYNTLVRGLKWLSIYWKEAGCCKMLAVTGPVGLNDTLPHKCLHENHSTFIFLFVSSASTQLLFPSGVK